MHPLTWPHNPETALFAAAHLAIAAAVTLHALLNKRDVRAAIGWIGLVWLSPFVGSALYFVFGINRVSRRALRLKRGIPSTSARPPPAAIEPVEAADNLAVITAVAGNLTGRDLVRGNAITILSGGDDAYAAMLDAIRGARRSIALASYIFRADSVGLSFVDALSEARDRGVSIRVLVDGIGAGYIVSPIARHLAARDIRVARFLHDWAPWRMSFLNLRNHKKILVVDGTVGFTGGLNIGAESTSAFSPARRLYDVHFRIEGPVVRHLMITFAEDWMFTTGEVLDGRGWLPDAGPAGPVAARGVSSGPDEDLGKLETIVTTAIAAARKRIRIVTPYFLPDQHIMSTIAAAGAAGVHIDIVLPGRSDSRVLDWAMRAHLAFFSDSDVDLHLVPAPFEHAKLMTVDGCWCLIGSANWDIRSMRLNFEFGLECYDGALTGEIDSLIDTMISRAHSGSLRDYPSKPLPVRLRDAGARLLLPYL